VKKISIFFSFGTEVGVKYKAVGKTTGKSYGARGFFMAGDIWVLQDPIE
jgi:hypothetical protein